MPASQILAQWSSASQLFAQALTSKVTRIAKAGQYWPRNQSQARLQFNVHHCSPLPSTLPHSLLYSLNLKPRSHAEVGELFRHPQLNHLLKSPQPHLPRSTRPPGLLYRHKTLILSNYKHSSNSLPKFEIVLLPCRLFSSRSPVDRLSSSPKSVSRLHLVTITN